MSIFIDENIPYLRDCLKDCGEVHSFSGRLLKNEDLLKDNCEYLIVRSTTKVNEPLLNGTTVKFVGTATSGIDHIDINYLHSKGIDFAAAPGSNANSVAEYVLYSILYWSFNYEFDLKETTIGIIGYGNIGKIVAKYADYMGFTVLLNDPPLMKAGFKFPDYCKYVELDELCGSSQIITNHVPLTKEHEFPTFSLLDVSKILSIPVNALLIHASRGYVVDEKAVMERLDDKSLYAAIDVWENEPYINTELAKKTILSTPHIAGYSRDGKLRGVRCMAEAFRKASGKSPDMKELDRMMSSYSPLDAAEFLNFDNIFELLSENRRLHEDHDRLIRTLNLNEKGRGGAFDRLRKEYPVRRESL